MNTESAKTALQFIEAINMGRLDEMAALMPEDHTFIDSEGNSTTGKQTMLEGWQGYFDMFPDYRMEIDEQLESGSLAVLLGRWTGTYRPGKILEEKNRVGGPAAWRAIVEAGKIKIWQVYADHTRTWKVIEVSKK